MLMRCPGAPEVDMVTVRRTGTACPRSISCVACSSRQAVAHSQLSHAGSLWVTAGWLPA